MPCSSDYLIPSAIEIEFCRVSMLLDEYKYNILPDPDKFKSGYGPGYNSADKPSLDRITSELCYILQSTFDIKDITKYSLEMQMWWRDHQRKDAERAAKDKNIYSEETRRKAALKKLTEEDKKLLGLTND